MKNEEMRFIDANKLMNWLSDWSAKLDTSNATDEIIADAIDAVWDEIDNMEWLSWSQDRRDLPEYEGLFLVTMETDPAKGKRGTFVTMAGYADGEIKTFNFNDLGKTPIAWMPLPNPYWEEESK